MLKMRPTNVYTKILAGLAIAAALWAVGVIIYEQIAWEDAYNAVGKIFGGPTNRGELLLAELRYLPAILTYVLTVLWLVTKAIVSSTSTQQTPADTKRAG